MAKRFLTTLNITNLASDPASGAEGDLYYNTTSDVLRIYSNGAWSDLTGGAGGAAISVSASAPGSASEGDAWFKNTDGTFYVYDGDFWVETAPTDAVFSSLKRWTKTYSASTVLVTGTDDYGMELDIIPNFEQVYINGVFIDKSAYTVTSSSAITLDEAVESTDLVEVIWFQNLAVGDTYTRDEADALFLSLSSASSTYLTIASASATYEPDIPYTSGSPSTPVAGTLWIDSTNNAAPSLKVYNGSEWIAVSGAAADPQLHPFFTAGI